SSNSRVWGGFLISIGILLTLHEFGFIHYGLGQLWPLFLIASGVLLAWHANEIREGRRGFPLSPSGSGDSLNSVCIFGGIERKIEGKYFQGGDVVAIFGGFKIDLSRAEMDADEAVINATAVFGGGELIVPEAWRVMVEGVGIFGGYVDKTRHRPASDGVVKTLHVRGAAVFGGIEVKSW
ncbi:MAG TPA: LiaF domain-containing protein, partial [Terriglobales bacterium]|nr:LiaF domain-containing protein [Terriglobales bacterium]